MYVSKIHLRNWRNFREIEASLRPRVFVLGPNAVGKSNLLDAFRFLRDVASPGGGLSTAVASRGGVSSLRCLHARAYPDIALTIGLSDDSDNPQWEYTLTIGQDNNRRPTIKSEVVLDAQGSPVLQRPTDEDKRDSVRLTQTALEQISENKPFRQVADFLQSVSYQHIIPQAVRDARGFTAQPVSDDPFGRDFLLRVWNTNKKTRGARLKNITRALRSAIPQLADLEVNMDNQGVPHLVGAFEHWRPHAARQNETQFSDGTLRLLGLLWSVYEGTGPLLLEEPELSLHPEIVRRLPSLFRTAIRTRKIRRQVITSTYSREMLDDAGIEGEEVLVLRPTADGTVISPLDDADRALLEEGMTAADVFLPKAMPDSKGQFAFV